jgi:AcrR family transcriptional regulator
MARSSDLTRERIVSAASTLFYSEGIRAVSVDAVAAKAGLTKRTLYYHFKSKDDLVVAYLAGRDQPNLALFKRWFTEADGGLPEKVESIFRHLARSASHPKWKGCGFLRTSAELANLPGHPAIKTGAAHKKKFEDWLRTTFEAERIDPSYMETAGQAAHALTEAALAKRLKSRPRAKR